MSQDKGSSAIDPLVQSHCTFVADALALNHLMSVCLE